LISHELKAIYLHIGKTAGTSVENLLHHQPLDASVANRELLFGYDKEERIYLQHANAKTTQRLVGEKVFQDYFKFTVVRNPYTRMLSVYHYLIDQHSKQFGSFEGYIHALPKLLSQPLAGSHHSPQTDYTHIDGNFVCDHVCRFEELPFSFNPVVIELNLNKGLSRENNQSSKKWKMRSVASYYSPSMRQIMQDLYEGDFISFRYSENPQDIPYSYIKTYANLAKRKIKPKIPPKMWSLIRQLR
jgi:hypothetical protein